eukprot:TRINITY_DN6088_c0_g1_i6.p1 TRINITY_DN6088_c0_g1~~TRINITY_DN6088_c0_g1_i6.p1  ORF type:complete len:116 (+),score=4.12 TRINITY_DN6088_c0_g1_i6:248-595(+)
MTEELSIDANENRRQSFKASRSLSTRKAEVESIREKFPSKVPVIVERYRKEESLPEIDKFKFLVPRDLTLSQLSHIIRVRLRVRQSQAFFSVCIWWRHTCPFSNSLTTSQEISRY